MFFVLKSSEEITWNTIRTQHAGRNLAYSLCRDNRSPGSHCPPSTTGSHCVGTHRGALPSTSLRVLPDRSSRPSTAPRWGGRARALKFLEGQRGEGSKVPFLGRMQVDWICERRLTGCGRWRHCAGSERGDVRLGPTVGGRSKRQIVLYAERFCQALR